MNFDEGVRISNSVVVNVYRVRRGEGPYSVVGEGVRIGGGIRRVVDDVHTGLKYRGTELIIVVAP